MNPKIQAHIEGHAQAIAALLHEQALATVPEQLTTLEGIEGPVRSLVLQYVSPEIALFLWPWREGQGQHTPPPSSALRRN